MSAKNLPVMPAKPKSRKLLFFLVPLFLLLCAAVFVVTSDAAGPKKPTFTLPLAAGDHERVASALVKDPKFTQTFLALFAKEYAPKDAREEKVAAAEEKLAEGKVKPVVVTKAPSSGMSPTTGMSGGQKTEGKPLPPMAVKAGTQVPSGTPMAATPVPTRTPAPAPAQNQAPAPAAAANAVPGAASAAGLMAETGIDPANIESYPVFNRAKNVNVAPAKSPAKRVDVFLSLTCPYCWQLWQGLRTDEVTKNHILEDKVRFWLMPRSNTEAGVSLIYQAIYEKDPMKAYEFIDYFFDNRGRYSGMSEGEVFTDFDTWMKNNNLGSIIDLQRDREGLVVIGNEIQKGLRFAAAMNVSAFPTILVDGKQDDNYFTNVIKATKK